MISTQQFVESKMKKGVGRGRTMGTRNWSVGATGARSGTRGARGGDEGSKKSIQKVPGQSAPVQGSDNTYDVQASGT